MPFKINKINVYCFVGVLATFVFLYFLQKLVVTTHHVVDLRGSKIASVPVFPMDAKFESFINGIWRPNHTSLRDLFKGKDRIIVNFWATWCPPCIEELPSLEYLNREIRKSKKLSNVLVVTISVDETHEAISNLFKTLNYPVSFVVLRDPEGKLATELGTTRFPETYLVNNDGKIEYKWIGPQNWLGAEVIRILQN